MNSGTIRDPLRKREVALTPEEDVRQWFIHVLNERMKVPLHMMMSEASLRFGLKQYRADIVVYDRRARPVAVVECKRRETDLDRTVLEQALRYNMTLDVRYIIITNGVRTFIFLKDGEKCTPLDKAPVYEDMCRDRQ